MSAPIDNDKKNLGNAQLRLLKVIEALSGHEVFGIRLKEVAQAVKASDPTVLRDLQTLEAGGWAKQDADGKWRLGQKPVQISNAFFASLDRAKQQISETELNYTRTPK